MRKKQNLKISPWLPWQNSKYSAISLNRIPHSPWPQACFSAGRCWCPVRVVEVSNDKGIVILLQLPNFAFPQHTLYFRSCSVRSLLTGIVLIPPSSPYTTRFWHPLYPILPHIAFIGWGKNKYSYSNTTHVPQGCFKLNPILGSYYLTSGHVSSPVFYLHSVCNFCHQNYSFRRDFPY